MVHAVTHYHQPTNKSCSHAALATVLSYFGEDIGPAQILAEVPVRQDAAGHEWGTILQDLATWALSQGFGAALYTSDFQILDLEWTTLDTPTLVERLEVARPIRSVPSLGSEWSERYVQSYIDFVRAGGELHIVPYLTSALLDRLLSGGPLLASVCYSVLHGSGRHRYTGLRQSVPDDVRGAVHNHTLAVYGRDESGAYLYADPWGEPDFGAAEPEQLLYAIAAAQRECESVVIQLRRAGPGNRG